MSTMVDSGIDKEKSTILRYTSVNSDMWITAQYSSKHNNGLKKMMDKDECLMTNCAYMDRILTTHTETLVEITCSGQL